jgi:hypothetical protein
MKSTRRIVLHAVAALVVLALVPAGFAAKGGGGKTGSDPSLTLVVLGSPTGAAATQPQWGDQVTFNVVSDATYPSVELDCAQNGYVVYRQIVGFYPTFGDQIFTLKSWYWTGGAADCTATLYTFAKNGTKTTLATTSFHVSA